MKFWTAQQAADRLKVSSGTVRQLIKRGDLTDHGVTAEGKSKHHLVLESAQVTALAKARGVMRTRKPETNGHVVDLAVNPVGIMTRLSKVETAVAELSEHVSKLIAIWS